MLIIMWHQCEIWLTTTVPGLLIFTVITTLLLRLLSKLARKSGVYLLGRIERFLFGYVRSVAVSRMLAHRYLKNGDYFRFSVHCMIAVGGFFFSTMGLALVTALFVIYLMIHGFVFSRWILVFLPVMGVFLLGWLRDAFYFYGVFEQTLKKDFDHVRKTLEEMHKIHSKGPHSLAFDDLDDLYAATEKRIAERKAAESATIK